MKLIEEVARHFHDNSLGTLSTDLFYGHLPDVEADTSILVRDTGGMEPDKDLLDIKYPTFQVFIRAKTYGAGKDILDSVRSLLHGVISETLIPDGIHYRRIHALAEGGHIGKNEAGYHEFSINFEAEIVE